MPSCKGRTWYSRARSYHNPMIHKVLSRDSLLELSTCFMVYLASLGCPIFSCVSSKRFMRFRDLISGYPLKFVSFQHVMFFELNFQCNTSPGVSFK